jgi:hypothetical protein
MAPEYGNWSELQRLMQKLLIVYKNYCHKNYYIKITICIHTAYKVPEIAQSV